MKMSAYRDLLFRERVLELFCHSYLLSQHRCKLSFFVDQTDFLCHIQPSKQLGL